MKITCTQIATLKSRKNLMLQNESSSQYIRKESMLMYIGVILIGCFCFVIVAVAAIRALVHQFLDVSTVIVQQWIIICNYKITIYFALQDIISTVKVLEIHNL